MKEKISYLRCVWLLEINISTILFFSFCLPQLTFAQKQKTSDTKSKVIAAFNYQCATENFPKRTLERVIGEAMQKVKDKGAWGNGERAVSFDLNDDGRKEYFVLLRTMATGDNALWGVFSLKPNRFLGLISAEHIYLRKRVKGWSALTVSWHESSSESVIANYAFRNGKYVQVTDGYKVSVEKNNYPKFIERTSDLYLCER